jgi:uncharacterized RDD family membrane protein YckC
MTEPPPQMPPYLRVSPLPPPGIPKEAYTPWSRRFWAFVIDWSPIWAALISFLVTYVALHHRCFDVYTVNRCSTADVSVMAATLASFPAAGVYFLWNFCYRQGKTGKSIGKSVMKFRVVREYTWQPIGFWLSFVRQLAHHIDQVAYVGYLLPLWDDKRQTIADKIMKTVCLPDHPPSAGSAQDSTDPAKTRWKRIAWPWLVVGAVLLAVVGGCGTFLVAESDLGSNDAVRDGQFQFVVTDFRKGSVQPDTPRDTAPFVVLLSVTNTGTEPQSFILGDQKLVDAAGHGYAPRGMAALRSDHETTILAILPGAPTKLGIRFDLPLGTQPTAIELHESASSRGATVDL